MISARKAAEFLKYNPATGELVWRDSGRVAGSRHIHGYRYLTLSGKQYKTHTICWLLYYGRPPKDQIDHKNGIRDDNRIENLREATASQNQFNKGIQKNNTTGFKGVCFRPGRGYVASIRKYYKRHYLGCFDTAEKAHAAYVNAATNLHGEFARTA